MNEQPTRPSALRRPLLAAALALVTTLALAVGSTTVADAKPRDDARAAAAKAQKQLDMEPSALSGAVTGTLADGTGTVDGIVNIQRFAKRQGEVVAIGRFTGTVQDAAGKVVGMGSQRVILPVAAVPLAAPAGDVVAQQLPGCEILDLVLGPLDLDLLGLVVALDTVHLNITAEPGPGNLLGNLLCAVAGLLDPGTGPLTGLLNQLIGILNQLLGVLG